MMKSRSCSLLVLAATALVLCGQLGWAARLQIGHTTPAGAVVDSGFDYNWSLSGPVAKLKEELRDKFSMPMQTIHVRWQGAELQNDFDLSILSGAPIRDLLIIMDFYQIRVLKPDGSVMLLAGEQGDTIASLKVKIARTEKIACYQQSLMRQGKVLSDHERLDEFAASNGKILNLKLVVREPSPVPVRVKLPAGELITFELAPQEQVASLKEKIQAEKGVARERQALYLDGRELQDREIVSAYASSATDSVTLILERREAPVGGSQVIYVRLGTNRLVVFEIAPNDLVASLKKKISEAEGIAPERQHLYVASQEIADNMLLSDCVWPLGLEPIIDLIACNGRSNGTSEQSGMHVHVKLHKDLEEIFEVAPGDTLGSLKARIRQEKNMSQDQQLHLFNGRQEIANDKQLVEHVLEHGSQLNLIAPKNGGPQVVNVKLPSGRLVTYEIAPSSSVETLKSYINHDRGFPIDKQQLFFGSLELENTKRLDEYEIVKGSSLSLLVANDA